MYFDAHAHLPPEELWDEVLTQAGQKGVTDILYNAIEEQDWDRLEKVEKLCQSHPEYPTIHVALGIHPMAVSNLKEGWEKRLEEKLRMHPDFIVGETGLDGVCAQKYGNMEEQKTVFRQQLSLAAKYRRPVVMHCFKAWKEIISLLDEQDHLPPSIMSHSHHGDARLIPDFIQKYNMYFSYSSIFLPDTHPKIQECLKTTPLDRCTVESDIPDFDLGKKHLVLLYLVDKMARLRKEPLPVLTENLFNNSQRFCHLR